MFRFLGLTAWLTFVFWPASVLLYGQEILPPEDIWSPVSPRAIAAGTSYEDSLRETHSIASPRDGVERLPAIEVEPSTAPFIRPARDDGSPAARDRAPFRAQMFWIPTERLANQSGDLAQSGEQIDLSFPLRIGPEGVWLASSSVQRLEIDTGAVLPRSGQAVPNELWNVQVGTMHFRQLANDWKAGGILMLGSPSDEPFAATRDVTVSFIGFVTVPTGERDAWNFSLFYSPTGQLNFPIPGIAYAWRPNNWFQADLGIPFSLRYRPTETLTFSAKYTPLFNVEALATQKLGEKWSVYGGYKTVNEAFLLSDRVDDDERLFLFDQRLALGTRRDLAWGLSLDFSAAYVFDRRVFQATSFTDGDDKFDVDPGVAGTLQLVWTR